MKNIKRISALLAVAAIIVLCFASCSRSPLTGKWEYTEGRLDIEGWWDDLEIFEKRDYNIYGELLRTTEGSGTIEFKKDGSYCFESEGRLVSNPYTVHSGNVLVMYNENIGNTYIYSVRGNTLELTCDDDTAYFKKLGSSSGDGTVAVIAVALIAAGSLTAFIVKQHRKSQKAYENYANEENGSNNIHPDYRAGGNGYSNNNNIR